MRLGAADFQPGVIEDLRLGFAPDEFGGAYLRMREHVGIESRSGDDGNLGDEFAQLFLVLEEVVEVIGLRNGVAMCELELGGFGILR